LPRSVRAFSTSCRPIKEACMTIRIPRNNARGLSRRRFLSTAAVTGFVTLAMPYLSRAADRPQITHGVQSGDVGADGGVVWARADRPSQMMVEVATSESFGNARVLPPIAALPESDFTAKMLLENLPAGQDIFYRVRFRDLSHTDVSSEPLVGRFRTAPSDRRDVSFVWGGDVAGQGWGIIPAEVKLPDGKVWKNVTIPEKAKVAETLDEFRAAHKYNFLDDNVRAFNAEVPIFVQWDEHQKPKKQAAGATHSPPPARSTKFIRCAKASSSRAGSIARSTTVRISTCSCWTSAAIAARTALTCK